jgi:hypothetical protein
MIAYTKRERLANWQFMAHAIGGAIIELVQAQAQTLIFWPLGEAAPAWQN